VSEELYHAFNFCRHWLRSFRSRTRPMWGPPHGSLLRFFSYPEVILYLEAERQVRNAR
jgi:hypothetical protein